MSRFKKESLSEKVANAMMVDLRNGVWLERLTDYRVYQILTSSILFISGYFAIRACYVLPRAIELTSEYGVMDKVDGVTRWLFEHYQWPLPITLIILIVSLISAWLRYRGSSMIVALGLIIMSIGAHLMSSSAMRPIILFMQSMDEPY